MQWRGVVGVGVTCVLENILRFMCLGIHILNENIAQRHTPRPIARRTRFRLRDRELDGVSIVWAQAGLVF